MIGIELRDEEYDELIAYAKEIVKQAREIKDKSCMLIKRLALIDEEDDEQYEDEYEEPMYRGASYRRSGAKMRSNYRRMR